jgi:hypothetical protein
MGRGGTVGYFVWPQKLRDKVGDAFLDRVDKAIDEGEDLKATDKVFASKIAERNPEIEPMIGSILEIVKKFSGPELPTKDYSMTVGQKGT